MCVSRTPPDQRSCASSSPWKATKLLLRRGGQREEPFHAKACSTCHLSEPSIYSSISIKKTLGDSSLARLFPICFHIRVKEFSAML